MFVLILQSGILLAIAFILGCISGCLLRTLLAGDNAGASTSSAVTATAGVAAAATAGAVATQEKTHKPATRPEPETKTAPEPERDAEPVALLDNAGPVKNTATKNTATKPPKEKSQSKTPSVSKAASETSSAKKPAAKKPAAKKSAPATKKSAVPGKSATPSKATKPKEGVVPAAGTEVDNLKLIKGIGLQNEARLNAFGVVAFAQIADWQKSDMEKWGERLAFPGRIEREDWVGQAKILAKGGSTDFASKVRRGGVASSQGKGTIGDLGKKPRTLSAPRKSGPDNLTLIDGVGNALEKRLFGIGIYHFDQIAKLSADEQKWVGIAVGFPGRVERENWVEEAKVLGEGGTTDHARRVEEGKISTSRKSTDDEK